MAKGLYGQKQGNENRTGTAVMEDHYRENKLVEGREVATLHRMAKEHDWKGIEAFTRELLARGFEQCRINAMLGQCLYGVAL